MSNISDLLEIKSKSQAAENIVMCGLKTSIVFFSGFTVTVTFQNIIGMNGEEKIF